MAKKHRVKRQKQVEYLLRLERERDEYLARRKSAKRNRQESNAGEASDNLSGGDVKRERKETVPSVGGMRPVDSPSAIVSQEPKVEAVDGSAAKPLNESKTKHLKRKY